jgi:hypothetical protein
VPPPKKKVAVKKPFPVPVDYSGMDPEMAKTMKGESGRVMKQKAVYAPQSIFERLAGKKPVPAKKKVR